MPIEKSSASKKPERQIPTGHRFSNKKTTTVPEKTMNPRSCLRWKPTGRIFSNVRLRWIPTGKLLNSCTGKVDSEPTHGSIVDIPHIHACKQTLGLSAGTSFNGQKQQRIDLNADALYNEKQENLRVWLLKLLISKKPVPEWPRSSMFKRRLIAADQASVFMEMMSVHISSGLVLHQMTSDHNRSELGIHDHSNEPSSSNLVPKVVPLVVKTATSGKVGITIPPSYSNAEDNSSSESSPNASFQEAKLSILFVNTGYKKLEYVEPKNIKEARLIRMDRRFVDPDHPEKVYHLRKALYRLKQAPRACRFEMSLMGEMKFFLGLQIHQSPKDLSGKLIDQTDYRSKIGSLMYLTSSRQDIVQAVCYCARYQARPTEKHPKEVKRIFQYLRGTINMGLWTALQAEAEYVALSASCAQVMWMRTQLKDYGFNYNKIPLYCDSQSAIAISCNPVQHSRTKHIHTQYHFIKERVKNGIVELYFIRTEYQLADMFTKALPEDRFQYLVRRIGMRCLTPAELKVLANESALYILQTSTFKLEGVQNEKENVWDKGLKRKKALHTTSAKPVNTYAVRITMLIADIEDDIMRPSDAMHNPPQPFGFLSIETDKISDSTLSELDEPANYKKAMASPEAAKWKEAMKSKIQSMYDNQVWNLVNTTTGLKMVGCKWIFKKKTDMDGKVHTYKARLVVNGYTQTHEIDYEETFSPVAKIKSIRIMLAIAAFHDYEIWQMDVKTAFLNGKLTEDVFMAQPEGFENAKYPKRVCKIQKAIYGLKQASRSWNLCFHEKVKQFGFSRSEDESCIYIKVSESVVVFLGSGNKSSKQDTVADSTCESEYIAACETLTKAIWMKNFIGDLGVVPTVKDPIEILLEEGHVLVKHIRSEDNPADLFTKALVKSRHDEHATRIGLKDNIKF
ncbi:retrovirus-related pol polyprotein from transposon TNT 1-94 [Tanacetum coccineum]